MENSPRQTPPYGAFLWYRNFNRFEADDGMVKLVPKIAKGIDIKMKTTKQRKIWITIGIVLAVLVLAGAVFTVNLLKKPEIRLLLAGKNFLEETSQNSAFLLYGLDPQELVKSYVNGDTRYQGQIRISGMKDLNLTVALNYDARRSVSQHRADASVELEVLRFSLGNMDAYLDGQMLYLMAPKFFEEPFAIDTGLTLFQTIPEPAELVNADWMKAHKRELKQIAKELTVTNTGEYTRGANGEKETERFRLDVSSKAVEETADLLGLTLLDEAKPMTLYLDLSKDNTIRGMDMEVPQELLPGAITTLTLKGDKLQTLECKQESDRANMTLVLERQEDASREIALQGSVTWKQGMLAGKQHTFRGNVEWKEKSRGFHIALDDVVIEQDGEKLIQIDGESELASWDGIIEQPEEDLDTVKVWELKALKKDLDDMLADAEELLGQLQSIW